MIMIVYDVVDAAAPGAKDEFPPRYPATLDAQAAVRVI